MNEMNHCRYSNIAFISYKREDEAWAKWLQKNSNTINCQPTY